jgi:hypothetical protein
MSGCVCSQKELSLLGRGACTRLVRNTRKLAWMHKYDSTGAKNFIDFNDGSDALATIDSDFWDALLRHDDPTKRLYLTPLMENVAEAVTDEEIETMDSGRQFVTKDAYLTFEGFAPEKDASYELYREWKKNKCADLVFFNIDANGSIFGSSENWEALELFPIPISDGSFRVVRIPATPTEVAKIRVRFDWDETFNDAEIVGVFSDAQETTLLTLPAMIQTIGASAAAATTSLLTVSVRNNVIDNLEESWITGLLLANFVIKDEAGSPITPTAVTEISTGTYEIDGTYATGENVTVELDYPLHVMAALTIAIP